MENPNIIQKFRGSLIYNIIGKSTLYYIAIMLILILLTVAYDKIVGFENFQFLLPIALFLMNISIFLIIEALFFLSNILFTIFSNKKIYKLSILNDLGVLLFFVIAILAIKFEIALAGLYFWKELLRDAILKIMTTTF